MRKNIFLLLLLLVTALAAQAQYTVTENPQFDASDSVPAGNYSGITWLGGDRYAVVSDKSETDGFYIFRIQLDSVSGAILSVSNEGFHSSGFEARDDEGIAYVPHTGRLFISGEGDNQIREYTIDGKRTGRVVPLPPVYDSLPENAGFEALSYNDSTRRLWTCNETTPVTITAFDDNDLQDVGEYPYTIDDPIYNTSSALVYAHGIGTVCALDDGSLLLLEREALVTLLSTKAVNCKLYRIWPELSSHKHLLLNWSTQFKLLANTWANYEGMCLGPRLKDGSRALLFIADSQNRYHGMLHDWLKSAKLSYTMAAELEYPDSVCEVPLNQPFKAQRLHNPHSVPVTYSSSDETVATIDQSGNLTLLNEGTTTITATCDPATSGYPADTASYTLNVVAPVEPTGVDSPIAPVQEKASSPVYDLNGRRVAHPAYKEIYIKDGKKYIMR